MTFPFGSPRTFEAWLEAVVAPFPDDTAGRLRAEFGAHHAEALDALRDAGHPNPEGAALSALGPVAEVWQALARQHFTRLEVEEMRSSFLSHEAEPESPRRFVVGMALTLALPLVALAMGWLSFGWVTYGGYAACVLLLKAATWWLPRGLSPRSGQVVSKALESVWNVLGVTGLAALWFDGKMGGWAMVAGIAVGVALAEVTSFRSLWPYLPKALRGAR